MPIKSAQPCARALDIGYGFTKFTQSHLDVDLTAAVSSFASFAVPCLITNGLSEQDVALVKVDSMHYQVGDDAKSMVRGQTPQQLADDFFLSPKYLALARGAMARMNIPDHGVIDQITLGLPFTAIRDMNLRDYLCQRLAGEHTVTGRTIKVRSIHFAPPVYGSLHALFDELPEERYELASGQRNLTIDVGYGTFSWLTSDGLQPVPKRSDGVMGGVGSILASVLRSMTPRSAGHYDVTERLDAAILKGEESINVRGIPTKINHHRSQMDAEIAHNMMTLKGSIGTVDDIDNVFITGGGAHLYLETVKRMFPLQLVLSPMGGRDTSVRGLQILAEGRLSR